MKKLFVVERTLPGAGKLSLRELQEISQLSRDIVSRLEKPHWVQSFVTEDKIYCIHIAESEEVIREHPRLGNFLINKVSEVKVVIDPVTGNPL